MEFTAKNWPNFHLYFEKGKVFAEVTLNVTPAMHKKWLEYTNQYRVKGSKFYVIGTKAELLKPLNNVFLDKAYTYLLNETMKKARTLKIKVLEDEKLKIDKLQTQLKMKL